MERSEHPGVDVSDASLHPERVHGFGRLPKSQSRTSAGVRLGGGLLTGGARFALTPRLFSSLTAPACMGSRHPHVVRAQGHVAERSSNHVIFRRSFLGVRMSNPRPCIL